MQKFVVVKGNALKRGAADGVPSSSAAKTTPSSPMDVPPPPDAKVSAAKVVESSYRIAEGEERRTAFKATSSGAAPELQVKMSGYLKKKRKTMGGWRKLWFVLQNQLLLSYSSQEDYEKRLVSFKDVVSLVPGTIIRPTKGPRFIIETTSNTIYTYRCDDTKSCSEWITALVESLSMGAQAMLERKLHQQPKHLHAKTPLQSTQSVGATSATSSAKRQVSASRSWDSICQAPAQPARASPNLPIALSTAKLLRRHGMQQRAPPVDVRDAFRVGRRSMVDAANRLPADDLDGDSTRKCRRLRNFRLHPATAYDQNTHSNNNSNHNNTCSGNCSNASPATPPTNPGHTLTTTTTKGILGLDDDTTTTANSITTTAVRRRTTNNRLHHHQAHQSNSSDAVLRINSMFVQHSKRTSISRFAPSGDAANHSDNEEHQRSALAAMASNTGYAMGYDCARNEEDETCDDDKDGGYAVPDFSGRHNVKNNNNNSCSEHNKNVQVLNKIGGRYDLLPRVNSDQSADNWSWRRAPISSRHRRTASIEERVHNITSLLDSPDDEDPSGPFSTNSSNPFFARPAQAIPRAQDLQRTTANSLAKPTDLTNQITWKQTIDSTVTPTTSSSATPSEDSEPIYAVVNLREKYARRAKQQKAAATPQQHHPQNEHYHQSCDETDGYSMVGPREMLGELSLDRERPKSYTVTSSDYEEVMMFRSGHDIRSHMVENENIYEPINAPTSDEHLHSPNKAPMWRYFSRINIDALVEIARRRRPTAAATDPDLSSSASTDRKHDTAAFVADIRKRWGNHRKSIKNRMKRFYGRDQKQHTMETATSDDDLGSQAASCSTSSANSDTSFGRLAQDRRSVGGCDDDVEEEEEEGPSSFVLSEIEKYRRGEKHIFGSLGRLRKPRPALCVESAVKRAAGVRHKKRSGEDGDFQQELKLEVNRRCGGAGLKVKATYV